MGRFASLDLVRSLAGLERASAEWDNLLRRMLELDSDVVETATRRTFLKQSFVEKFQSYDQDGMDPTPQRLFLNAPVQASPAPVVTYSGNGDHRAVSGMQTLTVTTDYTVDLTKGIITILPKNPFALDAIPTPLIGGLFYTYASEGFQVAYDGGYTQQTGDDDWIEVPEGLQMIVAQKVVRDYMDCKNSKPWEPAELRTLDPYRKKDIL